MVERCATVQGDTAAADMASSDATATADIVIPAGNTLIKDGEYYMGVQAAPFGKWPPDMARMIGANYREITFTFYYY